MTSNNYQKANESIHLTEEKKEEMLRNILSAEPEPVRRRMPFPFVWGPVLAGAFALILLVILPRTAMNSPQEEAPREESAEAASGTAADYEESYEAEASSQEAPVYGAAELSRDLGFPVRDFSAFPGAVSASYVRTGDTGGEITLTTETGQYILLVEAADAPQTENYAMEPKREGVFRTKDANYILLSPENPDETELEALKDFLES